MADNQTTILSVKLDEGKTEQQLQKLVLDIEATKKAQADLNAQRKAGAVDDAAYAQQTVALKTQLKGQQTEQTALTKNLELYRTAVADTGNTYKGLQAQLSLAQRQFQQLDGSADNSSEAAQALGKTIDELRNTLKATDETQSLFVRNLGNYPKGESLGPLVAQLVRLEEIQKSGALTTQQAAEADRAAIGFKQQIAQAGAKEGKSFEETTNFVKEYSAAIRPATSELVKLTQQQDELAETSGEASEAVQRIGFRMAALEKTIKEVPAETKKLSTGLKEVAGQNSLVASATEKYTGAKEKFTQASNLAKLAIGGEVTALGLLRLAIIATGLGALVVVLGSVVVFLTKTAEGTKLVETVMAQASAVVSVVIDRMGALGKAVVQVLSGDFAGAGATAKAALSGIGDEVSREIKLAGDLSRAQQQLDKDRRANADTNKRLLRDEENLKNIRDNEFNTLAVRRKANEDAFAVEQKREAVLVDLAKRQLAIYQQQVEARGGRDKADTELLDKLAEAENELADVQEDAAGRRNEYITSRFSLVKDGLDKEKEATDKALEKRLQLRKDALALEAQYIERQLQTVQAGSDRELNLLQQKLTNAQAAELNVKGLTASQKLVIDAKYENDSLKLARDFNRQRMLTMYDEAVAANAAELAVVQKGTEQETELRREAIDVQLRKELAALDKRKDNAAAEALLRANAAKSLTDLNYNAALAKLDAYLAQQRAALEESNAKGLLIERDYAQAVAVSDQVAAGARLQLAREFKQDTVQLEAQATAAKIAGIKEVTAADKASQAQRVTQAQELGGALAALFAETVNTTGATLEDFVGKALILIIDSMEKTLIAAQVKIIAEALATPQSAATFGVAGFAQAAATIAAVTIAAEALKSQLTPPPRQFAQGTVLGGASHANGGVQLFSRTGYHFGEAEADEVILTKGVWQNPLLRPLASQLNVLGGGAALVPRAHMAVGGVTPAVVQGQLRSTMGPAIDYKQLAGALRQVPLSVSVRDTKAAASRDDFTQAQANT
jgi:hypothetical protein